jgi:hypothetical protein
MCTVATGYRMKRNSRTCSAQYDLRLKIVGKKCYIARGPRRLVFEINASPSSGERYLKWRRRGRLVVADAIGVERDRLETETRFASSGMDAIFRQEVPRGYFIAAVLPQLQLCHFHVSVVLYLQVTWVLHLTCQWDAAAIVGTHCLVDDVPCSRNSPNVTGTEGYEHVMLQIKFPVLYKPPSIVGMENRKCWTVKSM